MLTTLLNYQHQQPISQNNTEDYTSYLPTELLVKNIFTNLENLELSHTTCLVSKRWNEIANQDSLWHSWAIALEISEEDMNQGKNKEATISKISCLRLLVKEAEPLLNKHVKTAEEFDMAAAPIIYYKREDPSEEDKKVLKQLGEELDEKLELSEKTKKGFYAHLFLRRIGLSNFDSMEKYARKLQISHGFNRAWQSIAFEYLRENQLEEVEGILNLRLKNKDGYWPIIARIITDFCRNDQLDQAIQFLESHASFSSQQLSKAYNLSELEDIVQTLLGYAGEKKRFDIYENLITKFIPKDNQKRHLMHLIENLLKEKGEEKAKTLIEKYFEEWEKAQDIFDFDWMIPIYVQIKNYRQAWKLALQDCSKGKKPLKGDMLLWCLYRAFMAAELPDQAKEVEERINSKKHH